MTAAADMSAALSLACSDSAAAGQAPTCLRPYLPLKLPLILESSNGCLPTMQLMGNSAGISMAVSIRHLGVPRFCAAGHGQPCRHHHSA